MTEVREDRAQTRRDEAVASVRRHVVLVAARRGPVVLWDCDEPCRWNLLRVIRDRNWRERGVEPPAEDLPR